MKNLFFPVLWVGLTLVFCHESFALSETERAQAAAETDRALRSAEAQMRNFDDSEPVRSIDGGRWLRLSEDRKKEEMIHSMSELSGYGIVFNHRPEEYAATVEEVLQAHPERGKRNLTDLLAGVLYDTEPESREILAKLAGISGN